MVCYEKKKRKPELPEQTLLLWTSPPSCCYGNCVNNQQVPSTMSEVILLYCICQPTEWFSKIIQRHETLFGELFFQERSYSKKLISDKWQHSMLVHLNMRNIFMGLSAYTRLTWEQKGICLHCLTSSSLLIGTSSHCNITQHQLYIYSCHCAMIWWSTRLKNLSNLCNEPFVFKISQHASQSDSHCHITSF